MRTNRQKFRGFSLTELLFALGVLSIGMVFVAGVFPAGVMFTMQASERTIATVVAEEAFAKVRLLSWHPTDPSQLVLPSDFPVDQLRSFEALLKLKRPTVDPFLIDEELRYPTTFDVNSNDKDYYWSALCRPLSADIDSPVQVTVFVCRRIGAGDFSAPVEIGVTDAGTGDPNEILLTDGDQTLVSDGSILVDNSSGHIYRVRYREDELLIGLTEPWQGSGNVWVVPPAGNSSRNPCIAVHQRVIRFTFD